MRRIGLTMLALAVLAQGAGAEDRSIVLASTTTTENSGLLDFILPIFEQKTGIKVFVVALGTRQALRIGRNGDADVVLVHHRPSEDAFLADGSGIDRRDVMYNDFVIVGPSSDPAGIRSTASAGEAFFRIADSAVAFASRGDESGTYFKEQEIWLMAGVSEKGGWYRETGAGMGTTLNIASAMDAYVLTDRGTWITFGNKGDLDLLFAGDPVLFNPYSVILVNPAKFPSVKADDGKALIDWLVSVEGQQAIAEFQIDGVQAFCPVRVAEAVESADGSACPADVAARN